MLSAQVPVLCRSGEVTQKRNYRHLALTNVARTTCREARLGLPCRCTGTIYCHSIPNSNFVPASRPSALPHHPPANMSTQDSLKEGALIVESEAPTKGRASPKRGFRFWMIFLSICLALFLSALELTAVSTALPVIVNELEGDNFVWVGAAYSLASTAFLPMSGGASEVGRSARV